VIRFLLGETQHFVGGFGKLAGDPPDIYHSFMGLAILAVLDYPSIKSIHSAACISMDTVEYLEKLRKSFY
jgi:geranylgeranyl transferase type-1 subunit beta